MNSQLLSSHIERTPLTSYLGHFYLTLPKEWRNLLKRLFLICFYLIHYLSATRSPLCLCNSCTIGIRQQITFLLHPTPQFSVQGWSECSTLMFFSLQLLPSTQYQGASCERCNMFETLHVIPTKLSTSILYKRHSFL